MEELEKKIRAIDFDAKEQLFEFTDRVVEKQIGKSVSDFDEKDCEEATKIGKQLGESIVANSVEKFFSKDREDSDYIFDHSVVITDENFDRLVCVPLINLTEAEKEYFG